MISFEWTVVDGNSFCFVRAKTQREAVVKAVERGYIPDRSSDVRPRTGAADLMSRKEFEEFLGKIIKEK